MASARNRNQPTREKMLDARESALVRDGERLRMVKACVGSLKHRGMELGAELFTRASEADALSDKAVSEGGDVSRGREHARTATEASAGVANHAQTFRRVIRWVSALEARRGVRAGDQDGALRVEAVHSQSSS